MSVLKAADFYYGAFLSALLNYAGKRPSLFDHTRTESRRIYRLTTNKSRNDYLIYTKYATARKNKSDDKDHWIFPFAGSEVEKLKQLQEQSQNACVALICVKSGLKDSELAFMDYATAVDCLGLEKNIDSYRIDVVAIDNKHGLCAYGSGRERKTPAGTDNMLVVPRDALKKL